MIRKSTKAKFEEYYKYGSDNQVDIKLVCFIRRNWDKYKKFCCDKGRENK